jgi:hypothetical protein
LTLCEAELVIVLKAGLSCDEKSMGRKMRFEPIRQLGGQKPVKEAHGTTDTAGNVRCKHVDFKMQNPVS